MCNTLTHFKSSCEISMLVKVPHATILRNSFRSRKYFTMDFLSFYLKNVMHPVGLLPNKIFGIS